MLIEKSNKKDKRYVVTFMDGKKVHFGLKNGSTYIDHKDKAKRDAYIARHQVREDFNNPYSAGALSRWLLWGDYTSLEKNHQAFMKKFKLK
jgi:hypothetical protein